jgi:amino acid transporter
LHSAAERIVDSAKNVNRLEAAARAELGGNEGLIRDHQAIARDILGRSAWFSGSFYLTVFISIVTLISAAQNFVSGWAFPIVVIGGAVGTTIVGALQLRNDGRLSEENFLSLVRISFQRIGTITRFRGKNDSQQPTERNET